MASYINTNIASLNAQRNLTTSQSGLATSLQRLSSGLRINSAKDDAAGMAISTRFTTQINGLDQASRNANDGISLAQTAEGALGSISDNLQRIRELAVQAANSTYSDSDRATINQEVQQRMLEIDRTASQTSFNGLKILDGSFGSANFQVGANAGETIGINLGADSSMRSGSIGRIASVTSTAITGAGPTMGSASATFALADLSGTTAAVKGSNSFTPDASKSDFSSGGSIGSAKFLVDGNSITLDQDYSGTGGLATMATDIASKATAASALAGDNITYTGTYDSGTGKITISNDITSGATGTGVTIAADSGATAGETTAATDAGLLAGASADSQAATSAAKTLIIDGTTVNLSGDYTGGTGAADLIADINTGLGTTKAADYDITYDAATTSLKIASKASQTAPTVTGTLATFTGAAGGDGGNVTITANQFKINGVALTAGSYSLDKLADRINSQVTGVYASYDKDTNKLNITSASDIKLEGTDLTALGLTAGTTTTATSDNTGTMEDVSVSDVKSANIALMRVDAALNSVNSLRSTFGAAQNRFESVISNLSTSSENLSAARSRIQDTDFAAETAAMTRNQILQQAGTAMLAQANALPNGVLTLLRG